MSKNEEKKLHQELSEDELSQVAGGTEGVSLNTTDATTAATTSSINSLQTAASTATKTGTSTFNTSLLLSKFGG